MPRVGGLYRMWPGLPLLPVSDQSPQHSLGRHTTRPQLCLGSFDVHDDVIAVSVFAATRRDEPVPLAPVTLGLKTLSGFLVPRASTPSVTHDCTSKHCINVYLLGSIPTNRVGAPPSPLTRSTRRK